MSIAIVPAGNTITEVTLTRPEFPDGKVSCIDCRRMVFRQGAHRTEEGWVCPRCNEQ